MKSQIRLEIEKILHISFTTVFIDSRAHGMFRMKLVTSHRLTKKESIKLCKLPGVVKIGHSLNEIEQLKFPRMAYYAGITIHFDRRPKLIKL